MLPDLLSPARLRGALCCGAVLLSACTTPPPVAPPTAPAVSERAPQSPTPVGGPSPAPAQVPDTTTRPSTPAETRPDQVAATDQKEEGGTALYGLLLLNDRFRGLTPAELGLEIVALGDPGSDAMRQIRLALALMHTQQPVDTARALGLAQRVAASTAPDAQALRPLARLLATRLLEQRKLEDANERQAQQLREQQRRIEQLNERLEAMRAIERSLNTRPSNAPRGAAPGTTP